MSEEITAESFFGPEKPELTAKIPKEVQELSPKTIEDSTVCEVRFCTGGRLSAPPVLHFHDYTMQASQAIAEIPHASEHLPLVVEILNSMVVEDFDCGLLHLEEAKEVLLNIHAKWWGPNLSGYRYLLDDSIIDKEKLFAKENISVAEIPIANIGKRIKPLDTEIKEPISIKANGVCVKFIYPRIRNSGIVSDLLKKEFADEEQHFFKTAQIVKWNEQQKDPELRKEISMEEAEEYKEYLARRSAKDLLYTRAQLICEVDGVQLNSFEERVDALENNPKISVKHWMLYDNFLDTKGNFGVQDEVEFYSEVLGKNIVRSFPFRSYNFFPNVSVESLRAEQSEISFG